MFQVWWRQQNWNQRPDPLEGVSRRTKEKSKNKNLKRNVSGLVETTELESVTFRV